MSTGHQQYSTAHHADEIREYAGRSRFEVVRTDADESKNRLRIEGRETLKRLIGHSKSGAADPSAFLVYDRDRQIVKVSGGEEHGAKPQFGAARRAIASRLTMTPTPGCSHRTQARPVSSPRRSTPR